MTFGCGDGKLEYVKPGVRKRARKPVRITPLWLVRGGYILALLAVLVLHPVFWAPDSLFVMLLGLFVLFGLGARFLTQFGPFVLLLISYDSLRGLANVLNKHVHFTEMIRVDQFLTGTIPTVWLQQQLYHGRLQWYDYYLYVLYMMHFLAPLALGVVIWRLRPQWYWRYVAAFVLLSYVGFLTYVLFPAAPPWLAASHGVIPPIHKLGNDIWSAMGVSNFPTIYSQISPNEVAAVPSLHAAYPVLFWLFVWKLFGWRAGVPFALYPLSIMFGVVYLGEHYLTDVLLGALYAAAAFAVTLWGARKFRARRAAAAKPATGTA